MINSPDQIMVGAFLLVKLKLNAFWDKVENFDHSIANSPSFYTN